MKISVVIPARYESQRFPGKPLALIHGKSLIQRTYERVSLCPFIDVVVVATDDERIQKHVLDFGGTVCMTSSDCSTGTDRVGQAYTKMLELQNSNIIINVQGDEPCIDLNTIKSVADVLIVNPETDIATAVSPITSINELFSPNVVKCVLSRSDRVLYFSRAVIPNNKKLTPSTTTSYLRHIGIYGFRRQTLEKFMNLAPTPIQIEEDIEILRALENDMPVQAATVQQHAPGVDVPGDIAIIEGLLDKDI